jgi:hypothetical protein
MKNYRCRCDQVLYFENTSCSACGRITGFLPDRLELVTLTPLAEGRWMSPQGENYRMCGNYVHEAVCNWMVPDAENHAFCLACRLNDLIPNLSVPQNRWRWAEIEAAKRRLIYGLLKLKLPIVDRYADPVAGLAFQFIEDLSAEQGEFLDPAAGAGSILIGHHTGLITLNIIEADPHRREAIRHQMNEGYRTLLGHFRHEIGHYYWDRLVRNGPWLPRFRELFGDETLPYRESLDRYYREGARSDWQSNYISPYASSHPWEDWAESWAHYLHIADTLETAADIGLAVDGQIYGQAHDETSFAQLLLGWGRLALAMNALNRSMGHADAYPFTPSAGANRKIAFIHQLVAGTY